MQFLKLGVNLADTSTSSTGTQHGGVNANVVGFHFLTTQYFHLKDLKKKPKVTSQPKPWFLEVCLAQTLISRFVPSLGTEEVTNLIHIIP